MQSTTEINPAQTKDFRTEELTIEALRAQMLSLLYFIPFAVIFAVAFYLLWPGQLTAAAYKNALPANLNGPLSGGLFVLVLVTGVIIHELIHGITWSLFAKEGFRSIRFGVLWKSVTPYCHCKEPLPVGAYITGALMPLIIMGILPLVAALFTGSVLLFAFGLFFTLAAGGDCMIAGMLRKIPGNLLVQDHPSKIGCILYKPFEKELP